MPPVAKLEVVFSADTSAVDQAIPRVNKELETMGGGLKTLLGTAGGFLLASGIQAGIGAISGMVTQGFEFEKQMANVNSILQLSGTGIKSLSADVLNLAHNPGITDAPANLAAGLYEISSSGFTGADGLKILEASAIAASAGMTSTDVAAKAATSVLNAYGLGAADVGNITDMMFQTVNDGVISFEDLANNMGSTLPLAASLGIGFDQLAAGYAQMTLQGVNASAAETNMASLMKSALAPTADLTAAVQAQGYASAESMIRTEGMAGFLELLGEASGGSSEALVGMLGSQEAVNAALLLGGPNLQAYKDELDAMAGASDGAGAAQVALDKQMQSASFQIAKAKQELQILGTTIVGWVTPSIAALAGTTAKSIGQFTKWISGAVALNYKFYRSMGKTGVEAAFSALGVALENLTGLNLDTWFKRMGTAMQRPIDAARKMFSALSAGNWKQLVSGIGDAISSVPKFIGDALKGIETGIKPIDKLLGDLGQSWTMVGRVIQEVFQGDMQGALDAGGRLVGNMQDYLGGLGSILGGVGTQALDLAIELGAGAISAGADLLGWAASHTDTVLGWIESGWDKLVKLSGVLLDAAIDAGGDLLGWAASHTDTVKGWITSGWNGLVKIDKVIIDVLDVATGGDAEGGFASKVGTALSNAIDGATDLASGLATSIGGLIKSGVDALGIEDLGDLSNISQNLGAGLHDAIVTGVTTIDDIKSAIVTKISDAIGGITADDVKTAFTAVAGTGAAILVGIESFMFGLVTGQSSGELDLSGFVSGLKDKISSAIGSAFSAESFGTNGSQDPAQGYSADGGGISGMIVNMLQTAVTGAITIVTTKATEWGGQIMEALGGIATAITEIPGYDTVKTLLTDIADAITSVETAASSVSSTISGYMSSFTGAFDSGTLNTIYTNLYNIWDVLTKIGELGPVEVDLPTTDDPGPNLENDTNGDGVVDNKDLIKPFKPASGRGLSDMEGRGSGGSVAPPDMSAFNAVVNTIPMIIGQAMSNGLSVASTYATAFGSVVGTTIGTMVGNVAALMTGFTNAVGQGMSGALSAASTYANAIYSVVSEQFGQLVGNVAALVGAIPGVVAGAMNTAANVGAAAAYNAGMSIGAGLANGLASMAGQVSAQATALAAAADAAVRARLAVQSPSRVFYQIGQYVGDGFIGGMQSKYGDVSRAGQGLAGASLPTIVSGGQRAGGGNTVIIITPDSEQFSEIARKARRGGALAEILPQLLK